MLTTIHNGPRGWGHFRTWMQAIAVGYLIGIAVILIGTVVAPLLSWVATLIQ
jgi:hypothetical protein